MDAAWAAEIEQRTREIEQGEVHSIPWSTVRRGTSQTIRAKR
ncbi:MAG: addiction module protein [Nitrospiraceae bacterium]|nr:addiction module protein [Nitrospiraceae bacterium]